MAVTRACLIALVVALAVVAAAGGAAGTSEQRRRQVRSLLKRLNKDPLASIEMRPSYHPEGLSDDSNIAPHSITQTWHQNGKCCPPNTIPIRRTKEEDVLRASSIKRYGKKRPRSIPNFFSVIDDPNKLNVTIGHQHAIAYTPKARYYGTKTSINLWEPTIGRAKDFSLAQLWISGGSYSGNDLNTIEAGWQVYPELYGDRSTRLFIYWTDPKGGNWWLQVGNHILGYWPSTIFSYLQISASYVMWGGEVYSPYAGQTSTDMGSGHFPGEGYSKASYIRNIQVVDSFNKLNSPNVVGLGNKQPNCYNVQSGTNSINWGTYIFYGGPGKNPSCP
uniref:Neprosin PEP catalytic domain-containing protein n=1 Tax=Setaria italica TaxID=4555 RepID=K3ZN28_SETIT